MLVKILVGLVLALGVAYGGLKVYVAHSINDAAHKVIAMMAPVADIKYQGTTSSLGGMVGLTGITVHTHKTDDYFNIGKLEFKTDSLSTLMNLGGRISTGEVPKTFGLVIRDMKIPVTGRLLARSNGDLGLLGDLHLPLGTLACGRRTGFSGSDLEHMGVDELTSNIDVQVRREPARNDIRVRTHFDSAGINSGNLDMRLVAPGGTLNPRAAARTPPPLKSLTLTFHDRGWHRRVARFCAAQTGKTRTAYVNAHVAAVKTALARMGISVGDNVLSAYHRFLKDGASMTLSLRPDNPVDLSTLPMYSLRDAVAYVGPTLRVNGKVVKPLSLHRVTRAAALAAKRKEEASERAPGAPLYREIRLASLPRHLGDRVKLTTTTDRVFTGELLRVGERTALVKETHFGRTDKELVLLSKVETAELEIPGKTTKATAH